MLKIAHINSMITHELIQKLRQLQSVLYVDNEFTVLINTIADRYEQSLAVLNALLVGHDSEKRLRAFE